MRTIYHTFEEVAQALNMKVKSKPAIKSEERKCPVCGNELRHVEGTNIWLCDMHFLSDETLKNGTEVQVFSPCGGQVLAAS